MGILTNLFSRKEIEALQAIESEFQQLVGKNRSAFISLVGIKGKIKGLEIIKVISESQSQFQEKDVRRINAQLVEYYMRILTLPLSINPVEATGFLEEASADTLKPKMQYIHYMFQLPLSDINILIFPLNQIDNMILTAETSTIPKILKIIPKVQELLQKLSAERQEPSTSSNPE